MDEGLRVHWRTADPDDFVDERAFDIRVLAHPNRARVAAVLTTDDESTGAQILRGFPMQPKVSRLGLVGETQEYIMDHSDGRVTVWYFASSMAADFGLRVPTQLAEFYEWASRLNTTLGCIVQAVRLTPRVLTDYFAR